MRRARAARIAERSPRIVGIRQASFMPRAHCCGATEVPTRGAQRRPSQCAVAFPGRRGSSALGGLRTEPTGVASMAARSSRSRRVEISCSFATTALCCSAARCASTACRNCSICARRPRTSSKRRAVSTPLDPRSVTAERAPAATPSRTPVAPPQIQPAPAPEIIERAKAPRRRPGQRCDAVPGARLSAVAAACRRISTPEDVPAPLGSGLMKSFPPITASNLMTERSSLLLGITPQQGCRFVNLRHFSARLRFDASAQ